MRLIPLLACVAAAAAAQSGAPPRQSALTFDSSDASLAAGFRWAKQQALAYVFDGDPVGPWYEAALPNRQAFCMRDVSHQSAGAHALGLAPYTYNMLHRFAENIAESRDWCSYWEINRENKPAPVDYRSDSEFWYDLPANFDVLDACYRMYLWSGDRRYFDDPVFQNFYDRTVRDYVERWDLSPERVMQRKRPAPPPGQPGRGGMMLLSRGIPSYIEGRSHFVLGVDLLAAQYAGYMAYSRIQQLRGNAAGGRKFAQKADEVRKLVNERWWNDATKQFDSVLTHDYKLEGRSVDTLDIGDRALLYYGAAGEGPKARSALDALAERIRTQQSSLTVEEESHYAEIFYRYGMPDIAFRQILDLWAPGRKRREYPEVSYSIIGAIVGGMLGVDVKDEGAIGTLPALTPGTDWVELSNLPIRSNVVALRMEQNRRAALSNLAGPALVWKAGFPGSHPKLLVDGKAVRAQSGSTIGGQEFSWASVSVKSGGKAHVEIAQ